MTTLPQSPGVYRIVCSVDNKCYVGSTINLRKRWYWHKGDLQQDRHHNRHLQYAWNAYGKKSFRFEILECVSDVDLLHKREQYWLDVFQSFEPDRGYNNGPSARAPFLGKQLSEDHKQKLSNANRGRIPSKQTRNAAAAWHSSEKGREWHKTHAKRVMAKRTFIEKSCAFCGKNFKTKDRRKTTRFCSMSCKEKSARRTFQSAICPGCGKKFKRAKRDGSYYCSRSCATNQRKRNKDGTFRQRKS